MYNYFKYICVLVLFIFTVNEVQARPVSDVYGGVGDGQAIFYSFKSDKWYYQKPKHNEKRILTVARREDCEGYSEYVSDDGNIYSPAGANYEFLYNGRLITYHTNEVKFFEIIYNKKNKAFLELPLEEKEIKKIMGNPKIIHISDFDAENKIKITKIPFKTQSYLILNDTDKYFYKYSIDAPQQDGTIKTLFKVKKRINIMYKYYLQDRPEFPAYQIQIIF